MAAASSAVDSSFLLPSFVALSSFFSAVVELVPAKENPPADEEPNENGGFESPPEAEAAAPNPNPTGLPRLPDELGGLPNVPKGLDVEEGIPNGFVAGLSPLASDLA